jgi:hypothetical protein
MELVVNTDTVETYMHGSFDVTFDAQGSPVVLTKAQIFPFSAPPVPFGNVPTGNTVTERITVGEAWTIQLRTSSNAAPDVWKTVCCVRPSDQAWEPTLVESLKVLPGGTYADFSAQSGQNLFMRVWVTNKSAIPSANVRPKRVDEVHPELADIRGGFSGGKIHNVHVEPLASGTDYDYAVQYLDEDGHMQFVTGRFKTKQRKVDVAVSKITVVDDGDWSATGEAEFVVAIWKRDRNGNEKVINSQKFGDDDAPYVIDDSPATVIGVALHEVIGPEDGDFRVGINAHGREFDEFSDELASTGDQINLWNPWWPAFPTGPSAENYIFDQEISVPSVNDETFSFKISAKLVVSYV